MTESLIQQSKSSAQRDDLKPCPFCGTKSLETARMANNSTSFVWFIQCGNPFCEMTCRTHDCAALSDAERIWEERS